MKQTISILGCGWLGAPLARHLHQKGYTVYGSTRSQKPAQIEGIRHFTLDISDRQADYSDFLSTDVLVIAIPSKDVSSFQHLTQQIAAPGLKKIMYISSTSVYPFTNGIVTEETPTKDTSLTQIETLLRNSHSFETTILRFGGLFGYDRKPGNFIRPGRKMRNPEGYINLIHQDDCIAIIEAIIEQNLWGETLNACTDDHPKRRAFYTKEAAKLGKTEVAFDEQSANEFKIVRSEKLKNLLGYEFIHADLMAY